MDPTHACNPTCNTARAQRSRRVLAFVCAAAMLMVAAGCGGDDGPQSAAPASEPTAPSADVLVERTYELETVEAVGVTSAFTVDVNVGGEMAVVVEASSSIIDEIEVERRGDLLHLGLDDAAPSGVVLRAVVTVPHLTRLEVHDASDVFVNAVDADGFVAEIGGASDVAISGRADSARITVDGASDADLGDFEIVEAIVAIDGASDVDLREAASVTGSVTGAATLQIDGDSMSSLDVTGAATVEQG